MAGSALVVLGRSGGIRGRLVEYSRLHNERVLYGVDKFAVFVVVHSSGQFIRLSHQLILLCIGHVWS